MQATTTSTTDQHSSGATRMDSTPSMETKGGGPDDDDSTHVPTGIEQQQQQQHDQQFISLPSYRDHLPAKYYETGRHWTVHPSSSSSSGGVTCTCRYCGYVKYSGDPVNFGKSFCHLTGHFTRRECKACPPEVTAVFQRVGGRLDKAIVKPFTVAGSSSSSGQKPQWTTAILTRKVWDRMYSRDSVLEATTTIPPAKKKRSRKPTPKALGLAKDNKKKARVADTVAATIEHELNKAAEKARKATMTTSSVPAAAAAAADTLDPTTFATARTTKVYPLPIVATPHDLTRIVQDGHSSVRLMFYAVTGNGGKEALQQECRRQGVESRWVRLWKLVSLLEIYPSSELEPMMAALEIARAGRSVHSLVGGSRLSQVFGEAERMVQDGVVAPAAFASTDSNNNNNKEPIRKWLTEESTHSHYVEETAFLYHDPPSISDAYEEAPPELSPLPYPSEIDVSEEVLNEVSYPWHCDGTSRVVTCDLSSGFKNEADEMFWGALLECDHLTVVTSGLLDVDSGIATDMWDLRVVEALVGDRHHHTFKRFLRKKTEDDAVVVATQYEEADEVLEGQIGEYMNYLAGHTSATNRATMKFTGKESKANVAVNLADDSLDLIDMNLPRILPRHHDDFLERWKVPQVLPGGSWCMTNFLPASARPFAGPNICISPGGAFTDFCQNGHGTIDSGNFVLKGYIEVVMLRRLTDRHKQAATEMLSGNDKRNNAPHEYPHVRGRKTRWPTIDTIRAWKAMGYCPSVFILSPGQHVHINKGRLHAIRKVTNEMLPKDDCHYNLRKQLIREQGWKNKEKAPLCLSIEWDWQYIGASSEGINREVTSALECQLMVDKCIPMSSVATPRACLLAMAKCCLPLKVQDPLYMLPTSRNQLEDKHYKSVILGGDKLLRGITPSLLVVLDENIDVIHHAADITHCARGNLQLAPEKDTALNPLSSPIDRDGSDYVCNLCQKELENSYLRCNGCENLLERNFNICMECHTTERWRATIVMINGKSASNNPMVRTSCMSHTGSFTPGSKASCQCPNGGYCHICGKCFACSCTCHSSFTLRRRNFDLDQLLNMKERITRIMSKAPLEYGVLTKTRLLLAMDRRGKGHQERFHLLKTQTQLCPRNTAAQSPATSISMVDGAEQEPPRPTKKEAVILESDNRSISSNGSLPFLVFPRSESQGCFDGEIVQSERSLCVEAEPTTKESVAQSWSTGRDTTGAANAEGDSPVVDLVTRPREDKMVTSDEVQTTSNSNEDSSQTAKVNAVDPSATSVQHKTTAIPNKVQTAKDTGGGLNTIVGSPVVERVAKLGVENMATGNEVQTTLSSVDDSKQSAQVNLVDPAATIVQHKTTAIPNDVQAIEASSQTAEDDQIDPQAALVQHETVILDKVQAISSSIGATDSRQTAKVNPVDPRAPFVQHKTTVIAEEETHNFPPTHHQTEPLSAEKETTPLVSPDEFLNPQQDTTQASVSGEGSATKSTTAQQHVGNQDMATQAALEALSYLSAATKDSVTAPNKAAPPQDNDKKRTWSQLFSLSFSPSPRSPKEPPSQRQQGNQTRP